MRRTEKQDYERTLYFSADAGEAQSGHIQAECYHPDVGNSSSFTWKQGSDIVTAGDIQSSKMNNDYIRETGQDTTTGYTDKFGDLLILYEKSLSQDSFEEANGLDKRGAEEVCALLEDFISLEIWMGRSTSHKKYFL